MKKILIVEDRLDEQDRARQVVEMVGFEPIVASFLTDAVEVMLSADGVMSDMFFPPYNPLKRFGFKEEVAAEELKATFEKFGLLGDLVESERAYLDEPPPCGLLIVISAMATGKPVVVCTDGTTEGHHGVKLSWIFDSFVARSTHGGLPPEVFPFGWNDRKDWADALSKLIDRAGWTAPNSDWRGPANRLIHGEGFGQDD